MASLARKGSERAEITLTLSPDARAAINLAAAEYGSRTAAVEAWALAWAKRQKRPSRADRILALLRERGAMSASEIASVMGLAWQPVKNSISSLRRTGKIERAGSIRRSGLPGPYGSGPKMMPTWRVTPGSG